MLWQGCDNIKLFAGFEYLLFFECEVVLKKQHASSMLHADWAACMERWFVIKLFPSLRRPINCFLSLPCKLVEQLLFTAGRIGVV